MTCKNLLTIIIGALILSLTGCGGGKSVSLSPNIQADMTVVTQYDRLNGLTLDQQIELDRVGKWMDNDIIKQLNRVGFKAKLIKSPNQFGGQGHMLIISVNNFKAGNRAARVFVGYGAGGSALDLHYQLINNQGKTIQQWDDRVGSSKGGTYCAQTLNRNAINKIVPIVNGQ